MKSALFLFSTALLLSTLPALAADAPKLPFTLSKQTTAITAPLRRDGTPDYIAALNERYGKGVTPENNGFVLWLQITGTAKLSVTPPCPAQVLQLCGATAQSADLPTWMLYTDFIRLHPGSAPRGGIQNQAENELRAARAKPWKASDNSRIAAYLKSQETFLDLATAASNKPHWWCPIVSFDGRSIYQAWQPSAEFFQQLRAAFQARAMLRAGEGDIEGSTHDLLTLLRLSRLVGGGPLLSDRLEGLAMDAAATSSLGVLVGSGLVDAKQCGELSLALDRLPPQPLVSDAADEAERWTMLDNLGNVITGHADMLIADYMKPFRALDADRVDWNIVFRQWNMSIDEQVALMHAPAMHALLKRDAELRAASDAWETEFAANPRTLLPQFNESRDQFSNRVAAAVIASKSTPSLLEFEILARRGYLTDQMLQSLLSAAQMRTLSGGWPVSMNARQLPLDLYPPDAPAAVRYVVNSQGAKVYSIGPNNRDDGGVTDRSKEFDDIVIGIQN